MLTGEYLEHGSPSPHIISGEEGAGDSQPSLVSECDDWRGLRPTVQCLRAGCELHAALHWLPHPDQCAALPHCQWDSSPHSGRRLQRHGSLLLGSSVSAGQAGPLLVPDLVRGSQCCYAGSIMT